MKYFFSIFLSLTAFVGFSQISVTGPLQMGDNVTSAAPGDIVQRTAQFQVLGGNFNDQLVFIHSSITNPSNGHAFLGLDVYVGDIDYDGGGYPYDITDALNSLSVPGMNLTLQGSVPSLDPGNFTGTTSFLTSSATSNTSASNGQFIYVVERFILNPNYCGGPITLGSTLETTFGSLNTIPANGTIELSYSQNPLWVISTHETNQLYGGVLLPTSIYDIADNTNCGSSTGNRAARRIKYDLTGGDLVDPYFRLELNQSGLETPTLFEVNPADIHLTFHYVLESEILHEELTLAELQALSGNTIATLVTPKSDVNGIAVFPAITPTTLPTPDASIGTLPIDWNWWSSNLIRYVPSLADGNTPITELIHLHLSNLNISATGTGSQFTSDFALLNYITLREGSFIEVDYAGTFVPQDNIHPTFEQMRCVPSIINYQRGYINGFERCNLSALGINPNSANFTEHAGVASVGQLITPQPSTYLMSGDPNNTSNAIWDGDLEEFTIQLGSVGAFSDNRTFEVLHFDMSCSEIEFVLELSQGLSIPFPDMVDVASVDYVSAINCSLNYNGGGIGFQASDLFFIENGGLQFAANIIDVELLNPNDCCGGQRWVIRMPLDQFYQSSSASSLGDISILSDATLHFFAQACCPAQEPTAGITLKSYLLPGYCENQDFTLTPAPDPFFGTTYNETACANTCLKGTCTEDRLLMGIDSVTVIVFCPGCITPGSTVTPGVVDMLRHKDFVGYQDADDNGIADLPMIPADTNDVRRNMVRHGDVVSVNVGVDFYNGDALLINPLGPDSYNVQDLLTASSFTGCGTTLPDVVLSTHVLDIDLLSKNLNAATFSNMFCPLIQGAQEGGNTLNFNEDISVNHGYNNIAGNNYVDLANNYVSKIHFTYLDGITNPTASMILQDGDVVWVDEDKFRIAIDITDVNTAFQNGGTALSLNVFDASLKMTYELYLVTDVDIHTAEWIPTSLRSTGLELIYDYKAYATGATVGYMLGESGPVPYELLKNEPSDFCTIAPDQEWWCERGAGMINIAPYNEDRWVLNTHLTESNGDNIHQLESFITEADGLSPCAELGPLNVYEAGGATGLSAFALVDAQSNAYQKETFFSYNHFENEIRNPALPNTIDLYLPYPFEAEAIVLLNKSGLKLNRYSGGVGSNTQAYYILPLVGANAINLASYGITISTETIDPEFIPRFPDMSTYNNGNSLIINNSAPSLQNDGNSQLGGPVFDPSNTKLHTKVSIPISMFYDPSAFNSGVFHHPNLPVGNGSFPLFVADEYLTVYAGLMYNRPTCVTPSQGLSDPEYHTPYDLGANGENACAYYAETQDIMYFDGNPRHLLNLFYSSGIQSLQPTTFSGSSTGLVAGDFSPIQVAPVDPAEGTGFHPDFNMPVGIPNCISTTEPVHPAIPLGYTTISSKVDGVTRHPLDYSNFSFDVIQQNQLRTKYSGAVPTFTNRPLEQNTPASEAIVHYDQRSNMRIQNIGTTILPVDQTSTFQITFKLLDDSLNRLQPYTAPFEFLNEGISNHTYAEFINNNGFTVGEQGYHNVRSQLFKRHIDIDNLYFYLVPKPNTGGDVLNFYKDVKIAGVSGLLNSLNGTTFANTYSPAVPAAKSDLSPILFQLGDVEMATVTNGVVINRISDEITITAQFDCSRDDLKDLLNQGGTSISFPFDLVVNYNCEGGIYAWNGQKAVDFADLAYNLDDELNSAHPDELTFDFAQANRCANDVVFTNYKINPLQYTYSVAVNDATINPCEPQFSVVIQNTNDGDIFLHEIVLPALPAGYSNPQLTGWNLNSSSPWILTPSSPVLVESGDYYYIDLIFDTPNCTPSSFDINLDVYASTSCFSCAPNDFACYLHVPATGTFNYGMGAPGNPLVDFINYNAFTGTNCVSVQGPDLIQIELNPLPITGQDYTLNFTVTDGLGNTCTFSETWSDGTTLAPFLVDLSALGCNLDLCTPLTVNLSTVTTEITCNGILCPPITFTLNQSCTGTAPALPIVDAGTDEVICQGDQVTFTATGADSYEWFENNISVFVGNPLNIIPSTTTTFTVVGTNANGCTNSDQVTVTVNPLPVVDAVVTPVCTSTDNMLGAIDLTISGGTPNYLFDWDTDGIGDFDDLEDLVNLTAGTYSVTVLDMNNCSATASFVVEDITSDVAFTFTQTPNCDYVFTNATTLAPGGSGTATWSIGLYGTSPTFESNDWDYQHTFTGPGLYVVCLEVVTTVNGNTCIAGSCQTVHVDDCNPVNCDEITDPSFEIANNGNGNFEFDYMGVVPGATIQSVVWVFGDGAPPVNGQSVLHTYSDIGIYNVCMTVTYIFPNGQLCVKTICQPVVFCKKQKYPCAKVSFNYQQFLGGSTTVQFNEVPLAGSYPFGTTVSYVWFFGDGTMGVGPSPQHTYPLVPIGTQIVFYDVVLVVTIIDENGKVCKVCVRRTIAVKRKGSHGGPHGNGNASGIIVVPNPSSGQFQLEGDLDRSIEVAVTITNEFGKVIRTQQFSEGETIRLDLTTEGAGVYFIELINGSNVYYEKVVLIKQ